MEINRGDGGLYEVLLDGVLWNNCTVDADCPGRALCARNASWSAHPAMCFCSFRYNHVGPECKELGNYALMYVILSISLGVVSVIVSIFGLRNLVKLVNLRRFRADALTTSLGFAFVANLCTAWLLPTLASYFMRTSPPREDDGAKISSNVAGQISLALTFFFTTLSLLNISLVWIEIADSASKLRSTSGNVRRYRNVLIGYYFVFFAVVLASLSLNRFIIQAALIVPAGVFIIISYVIGFFRMKATLKTLMALEQDMGSATESGKEAKVRTTGETSDDSKYRQNLRLIQESAAGISISCFFVIAALGVYFTVGSDTTEVPSAIYNAVSLIISYIFLVSADVFVMRYLTILIHWRMSASRSVRADGSKNSQHNKSAVGVLATSPASEIDKNASTAERN